MTDLKTYQFSKIENVTIIAASLAAGLVISYLMYRNIFFTVMIVPLIPKIREIVRNDFRDKRRSRYLNEFRDFLFMASTSIGSGRSMKDAISESIVPLRKIHGENSVLANELSIAYERMEVGSELDLNVLKDLAESSGMEDVYDFVTIYSICKTSGASLITALSRAASVIIDKITIEREIEELVARKKREGAVIFIMPVVVIIFLNVCAPDYIAPMYETLAGRLIMTGVTAGTIGIYSLIQKIVRIDI